MTDATEPWHALDGDEALAALESGPEGLTAAEAEARLARFGPNRIVAREAADVVLTDDDFASIEAAVEEGRRVFDNVQKAVAFVLPTNLGEALVVLAAVVLFPFASGEPPPVEPTQILWINPDRDGDAGPAARPRSARAGPDDPAATAPRHTGARAGAADPHRRRQPADDRLGARAQAAFVYLPPMQDVFGSAPLGLDGWLLALGAAVTVLPVVEAEKW